MAVNANLLVSGNATLNRENLIDLFKTVGQGDTPFRDGIRKTKATNTLHEWGLQSLAEPGENAALEGDSFDVQAMAVPERINNKTQIFKKVIGISDTELAINNAGAIHSLANNLQRVMKEMKRDEETRLLRGSKIDVAAGGVGVKMRGVDGFLKTNLSMGVNGVAPDYAANTARTGGTARAFSETLLKNVIAKIWDKGGKPDVIICSFGRKQAFSGFYTATQLGMRDANKASYSARVDVYGSDNGDLKLIPDYCALASSVLVLEMDTWRLATLREITQTKLPKSSDSTCMAITHEVTLEALSEAANGAVHDLT